MTLAQIMPMVEALDPDEIRELNEVTTRLVKEQEEYDEEVFQLLEERYARWQAEGEPTVHLDDEFFRQRKLRAAQKLREVGRDDLAADLESRL
ncbi:MAG: hypothetical protein LBR21_09140 [Propionibacteriaceae bacterium]|jgi:hypothetical protein|nr:hypothetical protein [Propionibacteriaceae bacterium]